MLCKDAQHCRQQANFCFASRVFFLLLPFIGSFVTQQQQQQSFFSRHEWNCTLQKSKKIHFSVASNCFNFFNSFLFSNCVSKVKKKNLQISITKFLNKLFFIINVHWTNMCAAIEVFLNNVKSFIEKLDELIKNLFFSLHTKQAMKKRAE